MYRIAKTRESYVSNAQFTGLNQQAEMYAFVRDWISWIIQSSLRLLPGLF